MFILIFLFSLYIVFIYICYFLIHAKKEEKNIYTITIIFIVFFIILFIWYTEKSIKVYERSLSEIKDMYKLDYNDDKNIVSNYYNISSKIIFLEERIAHYQNNSNNFASLWLTLMSVLFITVTGFNLYNYNESKKRLDEDIAKLEGIIENNNYNENNIDNSNEKNSVGQNTIDFN